MDISRIDKNFAAKVADENGFIFYDVKESPFVIEGLAWFKENNQSYYRLPETMTEKEINAGALELAHNTAGVCVRFRSDSTSLMIRSKLVHTNEMNHMPRTGSSGFDSLCKMPKKNLRYNRTVQPNLGETDILADIGDNPEGQLCDWIINFPLYGGVEKVEIGIKADSKLLAPKKHKTPYPILFYGSSITQGGCASRPANCYSSMLCREVDAEQINLGFSGSGKGEIAVAEAIASLKLSALVFDYDHNAPDEKHLQSTHEPFFQIIRKAQPDLPVIFMSKCDFYKNDKIHMESNARRRKIIFTTYENALKNGDKNVYFIDGETMFGKDHPDLCTVDGCHPNDLGFYRMYKTILPVLKQVLENSNNKTSNFTKKT